MLGFENKTMPTTEIKPPCWLCLPFSCLSQCKDSLFIILVHVFLILKVFQSNIFLYIILKIDLTITFAPLHLACLAQFTVHSTSFSLCFLFHQIILVADFTSFETHFYRDTNMPHLKYAHYKYKQKSPSMKYFLWHQYALMVQML